MTGKNVENQRSHRAVLILGTSFGVAIGAAIGAYTGNVRLWVPLGIFFGAALGYAFVWSNSRRNLSKE